MYKNISVYIWWAVRLLGKVFSLGVLKAMLHFSLASCFVIEQFNPFCLLWGFQWCVCVLFFSFYFRENESWGEGHREKERILSTLHTQCGAQRRDFRFFLVFFLPGVGGNLELQDMPWYVPFFIHCKYFMAWKVRLQCECAP